MASAAKPDAEGELYQSLAALDARDWRWMETAIELFRTKRVMFGGASSNFAASEEGGTSLCSV